MSTVFIKGFESSVSFLAKDIAQATPKYTEKDLMGSFATGKAEALRNQFHYSNEKEALDDCDKTLNSGYVMLEQFRKTLVSQLSNALMAFSNLGKVSGYCTGAIYYAANLHDKEEAIELANAQRFVTLGPDTSFPEINKQTHVKVMKEIDDLWGRYQKDPAVVVNQLLEDKNNAAAYFQKYPTTSNYWRFVYEINRDSALIDRAITNNVQPDILMNTINKLNVEWKQPNVGFIQRFYMWAEGQDMWTLGLIALLGLGGLALVGYFIRSRY